MTNQSEGPAVEKARCERCGIAKPEHINHLWACCGDGPGYGDQIKPETVECLRRQLEALRAELATEREGRTHLEEAAELLKRRPTIIDGIQGLYDWMQDVESWKARDQSTTPAEAPKLPHTCTSADGSADPLIRHHCAACSAGQPKLPTTRLYGGEAMAVEEPAPGKNLPDSAFCETGGCSVPARRHFCADCFARAVKAPSAEEPAPVAEAEGRGTTDWQMAMARALGMVYEADGHNDAPADWTLLVDGAAALLSQYRKVVEMAREAQSEGVERKRQVENWKLIAARLEREAVELRKELENARAEGSSEALAHRLSLERHGVRRAEVTELKAKLSEAELKLAALEAISSGLATQRDSLERQLQAQAEEREALLSTIARHSSELLEQPAIASFLQEANERTVALRAKPVQQADQKNLLGFRCPKCGSSYFTSSINPDKSMTRHCRGPYIPGSRHGEHYAGCDYTWLSKHDNAHGLWNEGEPQELLALADQKPAQAEQLCSRCGAIDGQCAGMGCLTKEERAEPDNPTGERGDFRPMWTYEPALLAKKLPWILGAEAVRLPYGTVCLVEADTHLFVREWHPMDGVRGNWWARRGEQGERFNEHEVARFAVIRPPSAVEPADPAQPQPHGVTRAELVAALNKLGNLGGILTADKPAYWFAKLAEELEKQS